VNVRAENLRATLASVGSRVVALRETGLVPFPLRGALERISKSVEIALADDDKAAAEEEKPSG
jgi:hypothetical protein